MISFIFCFVSFVFGEKPKQLHLADASGTLSAKKTTQLITFDLKTPQKEVA